MRDDWQSMLINATLMAVASFALLVGAALLAGKALWLALKFWGKHETR